MLTAEALRTWCQRLRLSQETEEIITCGPQKCCHAALSSSLYS
jgi:hypothetical protein